MLKILIVAVNYNSYNYLLKYLSSINIAASNCKIADIDVAIADNSTQRKDIDLTGYDHINLKIYQLNNLGYLGGAQYIINSNKELLTYDFIAVSNVDIEISPDFFINLNNDFPQDTAWLAPQIWSNEENRDRNPKIMSRYSKRKLMLINLMYKFPLLDYLYENTLYKKKVDNQQSTECDIYAGHGSFILLTKTFFKHYPQINYPIFLFGEELYLAELIRNAGLKVRYIPYLKVYDTEHVSTGKLKKSFYYKCNIESIDFILKNFYNEQA